MSSTDINFLLESYLRPYNHVYTSGIT